MNVDFQTKGKGGKAATVEWYTPPEIIRSLGRFDLDPATSEAAMKINNSAASFFTKEYDGLKQDWFGRVWVNPPYKNPYLGLFIKKLSQHNNGIALVYNRCDSAWFQDYVLDKADSILFLRKRISFIRPDGTKGDRPGAGSVLIAYGKHNTESLSNCGLEGKLVRLENIPISEKQLNIF